MRAYERFQEICSIEQEEFIKIKEEWAQEIVEIIQNYETQISMLRTTNLKLCGTEYVPSIANFRDALFHYRVAYACTDLVTLIEQNNSIIEHLHRAVKDSIAQVVRYIIECITSFYERNLEDETYHKQNARLQSIIHELKQRELEIRLESLEIKRPFENGEYLKEFNNYLEEMKKIFESDEYYKDLNQLIRIETKKS